MTKKHKLALLLTAATLFLVALPLNAHPKKPLPDGVVSVDTVAPHALAKRIRDGYRAEVPWSEAFSEFVDVDAYVPDLSVKEAYDYLQDIYKLPEWTMSVWNVEAMGTSGGRNRYIAQEQLPPNGNIYLLEEKHPETSTIDWWVGHSPDDIWMHYYIRILDAQLFMGKPGIVINWVNFGHANFERDPALMQGFLMMRVAHGAERDNLIKILRWRHAGNTGPIDDATALQIGLVNAHLYPAEYIWGMLGAQVTPTVTWDNLYGQFISSHLYVPNKSVEEVWRYLKSPHNMEQWTVSIRDVHNIRGPGFKAHEALEPRGPIFAEMRRSEDSHSLDLFALSGRYAHALGWTPWMNSSMRVIDGMESVGKPGAVVVWTTFRHAFYDQIPELGEYWQYLPVRNQLAAANMKLLLARP